MDQPAPETLSPHRVFSRAEWAALQGRHAADADRRGPDAAEEPQRPDLARGGGRDLPAAVAPAQPLRRGDPGTARRHPHLPRHRGRGDAVHHRPRRLGRGRQVDDGARAARAAPALAQHAQGRADRDRRLPASQRGARPRGADGAQGLPGELRPAAACSRSSATSRRASATSPRRSIRISSTTSFPARRSPSTGPTS